MNKICIQAVRLSGGKNKHFFCNVPYFNKENAQIKIQYKHTHIEQDNKKRYKKG